LGGGGTAALLQFCNITNHVLISLGDKTVKEILDLAFSRDILSPEYFALLIHKNVLNLDLSKYLSKYQQLITDQVLLQLTCKVRHLF
jgi:hypothetical protein